MQTWLYKELAYKLVNYFPDVTRFPQNYLRRKYSDEIDVPRLCIRYFIIYFMYIRVLSTSDGKSTKFHDQCDKDN